MVLQIWSLHAVEVTYKKTANNSEPFRMNIYFSASRKYGRTVAARNIKLCAVQTYKRIL